MAKKNKNNCCGPMEKGISCCRVESVISVDERGQMILPKEVREKADIRPGDKLTVVSWGKEDKILCLSLIRAEDFAGMVKDMLGPMMKDIVSK
jgi:AbrB family looped-hinge helix DNA binding protein